MPETKHTFTYAFDHAFIQRALRRDRNWRVIKLTITYAIIVPAIGFLLGWSDLMVTILIAGYFATAGILVFGFYKAGKRVFDLWQRQAPSGQIRYELDDEGFRVLLEESQSRFSWQGLQRLWCYDDVWLLEIVKNQSAFFPPDAAGAEILD